VQPNECGRLIFIVETGGNTMSMSDKTMIVIVLCGLCFGGHILAEDKPAADAKAAKDKSAKGKATKDSKAATDKTASAPVTSNACDDCHHYCDSYWDLKDKECSNDPCHGWVSNMRHGCHDGCTGGVCKYGRAYDISALATDEYTCSSQAANACGSGTCPPGKSCGLVQSSGGFNYCLCH
jgi:hypothetical protein